LHVAGVKKVNIIGEQAERIFVEFSYDRLATLGVSPRDIFAALNSRNVMTPGGSIEAKGPQIFLRLDGAFDDLYGIRNTPIAELAVVRLEGFLRMGCGVGIAVAARVPLAVAPGFIVMAATGKNFDRITLGSLILALGLLVDDAIIAIETMVVKMEEGYGRIRAAAYTWSHTAAPMLAGTLVTAIGFMPNGLAQSTAGDYPSNMFWIAGIAVIA